MLPAVLLTMLFYLDQNISVRAVNACNLKKVTPYCIASHRSTHAHIYIQIEALKYMKTKREHF